MLKAGYICKLCGRESTAVEMRPRFEGETLEHYMEALNRVIHFDHSMSSPVCGAKTVDMLLPITKNGIGFDGEPLTDEEKKEFDEHLKKSKRK